MKGRQASGRRPESDRRRIAQLFGNLGLLKKPKKQRQSSKYLQCACSAVFRGHQSAPRHSLFISAGHIGLLLPTQTCRPFTNDRRPRRAHSSKLAHGLRKVVRKRRYVAQSTFHNQLAPLPAQPVLRGEHSLHCRTPARHLLLICFTLIPFLCPQVHRLHRSNRRFCLGGRHSVRLSDERHTDNFDLYCGRPACAGPYLQDTQGGR